MAGVFVPPSPPPGGASGSTLTVRLTDSVGGNVRTLVLPVSSTVKTATGALQAVAGDLLTLTTVRTDGSRVSHEPQTSVDTNHLEAQWVAGDTDGLPGAGPVGPGYYALVGRQNLNEYATIGAVVLEQQSTDRSLYFEPTFPTALSGLLYSLCVPCQDASWDGRGLVNIFGQSNSNSGVATGNRPVQFQFLGYAADLASANSTASRAMYGALGISFPASVQRMQWNVGLQTNSNRQSNVFSPFPFWGTDASVGVEVARNVPAPLQVSPLSVFARSTVTLPLARSDLGPAGYRQAYDLTGAKRGVGVAFS